METLGVASGALFPPVEREDVPAAETVLETTGVRGAGVVPARGAGAATGTTGFSPRAFSPFGRAAPEGALLLPSFRPLWTASADDGLPPAVLPPGTAASAARTVGVPGLEDPGALRCGLFCCSELKTLSS